MRSTPTTAKARKAKARAEAKKESVRRAAAHMAAYIRECMDARLRAKDYAEIKRRILAEIVRIVPCARKGGRS